jgi:hypothetical protein
MLSTLLIRPVAKPAPLLTPSKISAQRLFFKGIFNVTEKGFTTPDI